MAFGLNKGEALGPDAILAQSTNSEPLLPVEGKANLAYHGRLPSAEILSPKTPKFVVVGQLGEEDPRLRDNSFIWSDNWVGLHGLLSNQIKARLIYLDPPYATGRGFASRSSEHAYNDTMSEARYIEFMRRRLVLLREVLEDDGTIYVHIGHQMLGEMKILLDEIFGVRNFINLITRRKCSSKNFTRNQFANLHDYLLIYSKSKNYLWNQPMRTPDPDWIAREYPKVDEKGQYKLVPVHAPGVRNGETGGLWKGMSPPQGKHWQYKPSTLDEFDAKGEIHWSKNGNPRRKVYLTPDKAVGYTDYWEEFRDAHHQAILVTGYPTEKNFDMMKLIVGASSNPGDLVLDPFCGSGSTLHAASELGRRWLGIDASFTAAKTVVARLGHGRNPMGDFVNKAKMSESMPLFPREHTVPDVRVYVDEKTAKENKNQVTELAKLLPKNS